MRQRTAALCSLSLVIAVPAGLIALGLPSDQVIALASASAVLYSAWRQGGAGQPSSRDTPSAHDGGYGRSEGERRPESGPGTESGPRTESGRRTEGPPEHRPEEVG
ncbi:hypothetical protein GCM10017674_67690 [Streptomyces gardneri]|uniref:Uncharacterized protein n=1 Tax=Streptomyces gardneri TaxID=66892 RepID=A0A4Y3S0C8_9ACTN|nr:hypothetical protein SGA01_80520 [Streptomyces gardneri]GHH17022.1 hypothetical protein GCM10017674_67690 [Streptomyces gardneri]